MKLFRKSWGSYKASLEYAIWHKNYLNVLLGTVIMPAVLLGFITAVGLLMYVQPLIFIPLTIAALIPIVVIEIWSD